MNDELFVRSKENFLVKFCNGFISFIVGLAAFSIFKLIFMIPVNIMTTSDNVDIMQGFSSILVIFSIYLAIKYTKSLNGNGTAKSRNIKRIITIIIGVICLMMSTILLSINR